MFAVVYLQEEALAAEFTIKETMYYFGILFEMKFSCIRQRVEFLKQFLDLPPVNQLCGALRLVGNIVMEFEIMVDHWSFVKFSYCSICFNCSFGGVHIGNWQLLSTPV